MRLFFVLILTGTLFANPLQQKMIDQVNETGDTEYSALQIALIASGVEEQENLAKYEKKYSDLLAQIAESAKKGNSVKKNAKNLHAAMFKKLGAHDESNGSLVALLDDVATMAERYGL